MRSVLLLDALFSLTAITATMDSWPSNDESLFSDSDLAMDAPALPINELALGPSDQDESSWLFDPDLVSLLDPDLLPATSETDTSGLQFWDLDDASTLGSSIDDVEMDNSFQLADCSASESLPLFGKSRAKRNDNLGVCKETPDAASDGLEGWTLERLERALNGRPGAAETPEGALNSEEQHEICSLLSLGALPWGVCSSGNPADEVLMVVDPIIIKGNPQTLAYTLFHCRLGMSIGQLSANIQSSQQVFLIRVGIADLFRLWLFQNQVFPGYVPA